MTPPAAGCAEVKIERLGQSAVLGGVRQTALQQHKHQRCVAYELLCARHDMLICNVMNVLKECTEILSDEEVMQVIYILVYFIQLIESTITYMYIYVCIYVYIYTFHHKTFSLNVIIKMYINVDKKILTILSTNLYPTSGFIGQAKTLLTRLKKDKIINGLAHGEDFIKTK